MKRIDLHIHTLATSLDEPFEFDMEALKRHVEHNDLAAIAITNHNLFDLDNYKEISSALPDDLCVLPGIEVSVENFHILVIADPSAVETFAQTCKSIKPIEQDEDGISVDDFKRLFSNGSYIVIPHYRKKPAIPNDRLQAINGMVTALEVSSEKKWGREHGRVDKPVVLFSDFRSSKTPCISSGKYTYIKIGEISFPSLRLVFEDPDKFAITKRSAHMELAPGLYASMGLNVVLGSRSSGKTHFLESLYGSCDSDDVVYVRQFEIVKDAEEKAFSEILASEGNALKSDYYEPMAEISAAAEQLKPREDITKEIKNYLTTLVEYADTSAREDEYSRCPLFKGARLPIGTIDAEKKVVDALITLLEENPLSDEIESKIASGVLENLLSIAIKRYKNKTLECDLIERTNAIALKVRNKLSFESNRPPCPISPMLEAAKRDMFVKRLARLREEANNEAIISIEPVGKFKRIMKRTSYKDANALKKAIGTSQSMSKVLQLDSKGFVERILETSDVSDISRALFDIVITLENEQGENVSGGQRAEYLFFRALNKAGSHDIVLIDEPESSFDNPFLNDLIASKLKQISNKSTVFIATHNNVLGVSIKPDGIVYTSIEDGNHVIYTGDLSDDHLTSSDGRTKKRNDVLLQLMEAGSQAYEGRRPYYGLAQN